MAVHQVVSREEAIVGTCEHQGRNYILVRDSEGRYSAFYGRRGWREPVLDDNLCFKNAATVPSFITDEKGKLALRFFYRGELHVVLVR